MVALGRAVLLGWARARAAMAPRWCRGGARYPLALLALVQLAVPAAGTSYNSCREFRDTAGNSADGE